MLDDASVIPAVPRPDISDDGVVSFWDYAELAQTWLCDTGNAGAAVCDLDMNSTVGIGDLAILSEQWLTYDDYVSIDIDDTVRYQEMDGFGASLTETSAWLICKHLGPKQRQLLMKELFDPNSGIGLSCLRQPMGSCDFRIGDPYTYDDVAYPETQDDFELERFSIEPDKVYIIPLFQEAKAINPDLKIIASPWSPPAWMKDSRDLYCGRLRDIDAVYDAYAEYFVRFVQIYAKEGLAIDAVTLQNEPKHEPTIYPGMLMSIEDQIRLAISVGRKFTANASTQES